MVHTFRHLTKDLTLCSMHTWVCYFSGPNSKCHRVLFNQLYLLLSVLVFSASAIISHLSQGPWKAVDLLLSTCRLWGNGFVTSQTEADPRTEQRVAQIRIFFSHRIFLKWFCWRYTSHYLLAVAGLNSEITSVVLKDLGFIQVEFRELKEVFTVLLSFHITKLS